MNFRIWNAKDGWYFKPEETPAIFPGGKVADELGFYDDLVVERGTEITNRYGEDIFEGDIVSFSINHQKGTKEYRAQIIWLGTGLTAKIIGEMVWDNGLLETHVAIGNDMRVIGNTRENPELLRT